MEAGGGVDRLSNLPESIIHHILSFLDTESAVKTCVLSKQWESTWKNVHTLNLNLSFIEYSRCERLVDNVLYLRYPLHVSKVLWLTNMRCAGRDESEFSLLRKVVQYAVSHGTQHFDLRPYSDNPHIPLFELFDDSISDSVTSLELSWFCIYCEPEWSRQFRLLTTLKLQRCILPAQDGELVKPFSQFPCLKDLFLDIIEFVSDDRLPVRLRVSGLELINLTLSNVNVCKLEIFAPKLKSLRLVDVGEFLELTLPSLVHADIRECCLNFTRGNVYVHKKSVIIMFHGLHNVESLTLCHDMNKEILGISKFLEQQPCPFKRLKKLNLELASLDEIPYEVLDNYFFDGSSDAGLIIQTLKQGFFWQVMVERLP